MKLPSHLRSGSRVLCAPGSDDFLINRDAGREGTVTCTLTEGGIVSTFVRWDGDRGATMVFHPVRDLRQAP